jgi:CHASE3 domain sensor protein
MRGRFQIGSIVLLLMAAVATMVFGVREYRSGRDASRLLYTRSLKKHDIVDAARNALAARNDAELREQNYVLTGETVYSEAYTDDIPTWKDESGTLDLVAKNDPAGPLVHDLLKAGTHTLGELALVVSLYENSGRDAALERIRKSSGIVYLDQARSSVAKILDVDDGPADGAGRITGNAVLALRRLGACALILFLLAVAGAFLPILEERLKR